MDYLNRLVKSRGIQVSVGLVFLIGYIVALTSGTAFVQEHALAILLVLVLIVAALDLL